MVVMNSLDGHLDLLPIVMIIIAVIVDAGWAETYIPVTVEHHILSREVVAGSFLGFVEGDQG
ncbi:hypothetical protein TIFTF001_054943 [Ficus carica]|uniref:Uncharacterized protein n=2 Tax=Ficus carica TaxID=3494 RepID=A0AA88JEJ2_FICCA|nr:hypothetical protein TIFTF001_054941 [Ficus carica]GMN73998.1 hypothetical protein TIFTF001_054943 [Ficus carica]